MRPKASTVLHGSAQNISIVGCVWLLPVYRKCNGIPSLFNQFVSVISGKDATKDTPEVFHSICAMLSVEK